MPNKGKEFFTIMDFRNNTEKFADPSFNGPAEVVLNVDGGNATDIKTAHDFGVDNPVIQIPISGEVEEGVSKKIYIKDVPVTILNETVKYYDADGKLITESIVEYSGKNLKRLYEKYDDFEQEWYRADSKKDFLDHLYGEGVMVDAIYEKVNDNIDIFDILANMTYGKEVMSKDERIEKVQNSDFLKNYNDSQKSVIDELLNTYKNKDVIELENIKLLEVKNFNKFGGLVPIINLFGGKNKYLNVISNIERALYS